MTYREEIIGDCQLILGDCREVLPCLSLSYDSCITDPPYGMNYQSAWRTDKHKLLNGDDSTELLTFACSLPVSHSRYVFCRWDVLGVIAKPQSVITWIKNNWTSGDLNHSHSRQTEMIAFFNGPGHRWTNGRPSDVIDRRKALSDDHPTEKPVDLMTQIVEWTSGTVLDPFMGSGATGCACIKLKRRFIGIEIDQVYFELACRRIEEAAKQGDFFL